MWHQRLLRILFQDVDNSHRDSPEPPGALLSGFRTTLSASDWGYGTLLQKVLEKMINPTKSYSINLSRVLELLF